MIAPAGLFDLLVRIVEEHGVDAEVQPAVDADHKRQEASIRRAAEGLGLDPDEVAPRSGSGGVRRSHG